MILLFDLDGTLTDPRAGFVRSVRYALERLGAEAPDDTVIARFIGPPLRGTFATLLGAQGARIEEAVDAYRERYMDVGIFETERYDGVLEMLERARELADRMFVATSKPFVSAVRVVRHLGIDHLFDRVYGPDLDGALDDKALLIAHLLERESLAAGSTVMVGDREADVVAAKRNGVAPVGVLWGYGSRAELESAGAESLVDSPGELPSALERRVRAPVDLPSALERPREPRPS